MATAPNLALGYGTPAYDEYEAAQQNIKDMLAQRENRLFDPTLLAMAQGFLAPTRTGSFGESLGNVAGAVIPAQQAEDKRAMDLAKMRFEVAQQGLQTDIGIRKQQGLADFLNKNTAVEATPQAPSAPQAQQGAPSVPQGGVATSTIPSAPVAQTAPAPVTGGLPSTAPVAPVQAPQAPQATQAPQAPQTPQAPQVGFSGGLPLGMPGSQQQGAKGFNWNKQEADYFKLGISENKPATELIKDINEMRTKDTVWKEGYGIHIPSNTVYPIPSAEQVEIQLPGDKSPRKVFKSDSLALQHYAATNDPRYREVLDRMKYGPSFMRQPVVPTATNAPVSTEVPTVAESAATKAGAEAEASAAGTSAGKRTGAAMDKYDQAIESKNSALSVKELISQPNADLAVGVFEKPTVKAAILGMVNDGVFSDDKFRDAYTKANIKFNIPKKMGEKDADYEQRKQDVYDRASQIASQAAYLQFQTSLLAKGQGAISNNERQLFANTTLGVKDSVNTMIKKADMIVERANFAQSVASALTDKQMSLDQFRRTPEYQKMEKAYEDRLRNIWNPTRAQSQGTQGSPDLEAARRRLVEKI